MRFLSAIVFSFLARVLVFIGFSVLLVLLLSFCIELKMYDSIYSFVDVTAKMNNESILFW